jgi:hypothetical protein
VSSAALKIERPADSNFRTLSDLHRDFLSEAAAVDLDAGRRAGAGIVEGNDDIVSQFEKLVGMFEKSQGVVDTLLTTAKNYEELAYELKARLSEESAQKGAAYENAARLEVAIRVERERADSAEERANSAEEQLRQLQSREALIRERLARLTDIAGKMATVGQIKTPPSLPERRG